MSENGQIKCEKCGSTDISQNVIIVDMNLNLKNQKKSLRMQEN